MNFLYSISPLILQEIIWIPTRIILNFFIHLKIEGLENLNNINNTNHHYKNVIFASNHTSELDPVLLPAALPFFSKFSPIFYASLSKGNYRKSGWRQIFYGGFIFKLWGAHPIYTGLKDYEKSLINHIKILEDNKDLLFFPEGKITPDGNIGNARGGVAYLSKHTGRKIIPMAISGVYNMTLKDFFMRRRYAKVILGKAINPNELKNNNYRKEAEEVMNRVRMMVR